MRKMACAQPGRRSDNPAFNPKVALAALRQCKTMAAICKEFERHPTQMDDGKRQALEHAADVFRSAAAPEPVNLVPLQAALDQFRLIAADLSAGEPARAP